MTRPVPQSDETQVVTLWAPWQNLLKSIEPKIDSAAQGLAPATSGDNTAEVRVPTALR
jgi:hypothetical protein